MNEILSKLNFLPLEQFIRENMKINVMAKDIFINCNIPVPLAPISSQSLGNHDILKIALERCKENNHLSAGYNKTHKEWYNVNTSRNLLKSKKWAAIFEAIGFDYSIFILINSTIVEKVGKNFVLLCGEIGSLGLNKEKLLCVQRDTLFLGRCKNLAITIESAVAEVLHDQVLSSDAYEKLTKTLIKVLNKYNKLPINSIFRSFFDHEFLHVKDEIMDNSLEVEKIVDFLFLISKKFLKPIFTQKHFKILKGKLTLLMKRNVFETLNHEDLTTYFSTTSFKFFEGTSDINNDSKSKILLKLMAFLFNSVYLKIISMYFYSTTTSYSRRKIYYFLRIYWNMKTTKFCSEYLKNFSKTASVNTSVATLRCIPKNSGFRIITNCSSQSSYRHILKGDHETKASNIVSNSEKGTTYNLNSMYNCIPKINNVVQNDNSHSNLYHNSISKNRIDDSDKKVYSFDNNINRCPIEKTNVVEHHLTDLKNDESIDNSLVRHSKSNNQMSTNNTKTPLELHRLFHRYEDINEILTDSSPKIQKNSIEKLASRYEDIGEILINCNTKTENKPDFDYSTVKKDLNIKNIPEPKIFTKKQIGRASSINFKAGPLLPILKNAFLKNEGFSLLRHNHIKEKLYKFLKTKNTRLFLLKVDLQQCFDNIPQDAILNIISNLLTEDEYFYQEMQIFQTKSINSKIEKIYLRRSPDFLLPLNLPEAQPLAYELPPDIKPGYIMKENRMKIFSKSQISRILNEIVKNTVIKYQNSYYTRKIGISQGCTISAILCAIYYAYLDKHFNGMKCFISRYVDDFLVIADNYDDIAKFLEISTSLKEKGFIINQSKISSNIDISTKSGNIPIFKSNFIEWCGLKIFDQKVAIKSECDHMFFRYLVSIHSSKRGEKILIHLEKAFQVKFSSMLINLNNQKTGENIFDGIYFVCRKLKILISRATFINQDFVDKILMLFKENLEKVLDERRIRFHPTKITRMLNKAFAQSGILELRPKKFLK